MLNIIMLSVIMLSVIMLSVIMLRVVAPLDQSDNDPKFKGSNPAATTMRKMETNVFFVFL
jgi:hypothetical protein